MRLSLVPRTRGGVLRMIVLASLLSLLFVVIWLLTVKMPGAPFAGPLPPPSPGLTRPSADVFLSHIMKHRLTQ